MSDYEAVIGLEVHVELNTKTKLFSRARNGFGDDPNTNIGVVCTGQPGSLPVLNVEALRKGVRLGLALGAHIQPYSRFDRKSYFYPDSPRNYQITQFAFPLLKGGEVVAEVDGVERAFPVHSAHLEDDAGMLKHFSSFAGVDYNRAGVPLIEIVSEPCFHSAQEAVAYAMSLKTILDYIDASDCNMEEGSLRFDANISLRLKGEKRLRNKIEIKNMNSFQYLAAAIRSEVERQEKIYREGGTVEPATYRWNPEKGETLLMRKKEQAEDYRYFPEPDLLPIHVSEAFIEKERGRLPELPRARRRRYQEELGLPSQHVEMLVLDKKLGDYYDEAYRVSPSPKDLCRWILVEFPGRFKEFGKSLLTSGIPPKAIGELVRLIEEKEINGKIAKSVADEMVKRPDLMPKEIVASNPAFSPVTSEALLLPLIQEVMEMNSASISDYRNGKERAFSYLVGQVMKRTGGQADPTLVDALLKEALQRQ